MFEHRCSTSNPTDEAMPNGHEEHLNIFCMGLLFLVHRVKCFSTIINLMYSIDDGVVFYYNK